MNIINEFLELSYSLSDYDLWSVKIVGTLHCLPALPVLRGVRRERKKQRSEEESQLSAELFLSKTVVTTTFPNLPGGRLRELRLYFW